MAQKTYVPLSKAQALEKLAEIERRHVFMHQREYASEIADKLEAGEVLDDLMARDYAIGLLRWWAKQPEIKPKRKVGRPNKFMHDEAALLVEIYVRKDMKRRVAEEKVAEMYEVSREAVRDIPQKHKAEAVAFLDSMHGKKL